MLAKLTDAVSMFWLSLDDRERAMIFYGAAFLLAQIALVASKRDREHREELLLARVQEMVSGAR